MGNAYGEIDEELVQKYYDINVDHDWWDYVYEDFKEQMAEKGVHVDKMFFSGFYSQGDGACFEGAVFVQDFARFMDIHDLSSRYPAAKFMADNSELGIQISKESHHYCHENTVGVYLRDTAGNPYEDFSTRWEIYDTMQTLFDSEFAQLELDCEEILKGYMHDLYRKLQQEYEYLTSAEAVWETIVANDLHKEVA